MRRRREALAASICVCGDGAEGSASWGAGLAGSGYTVHSTRLLGWEGWLAPRFPLREAPNAETGLHVDDGTRQPPSRRCQQQASKVTAAAAAPPSP